MHDENTVSLKVYVYEGNNPVEIRRFEVDQTVITNYDYIRERLQIAVPRLREKIYKLKWQDAEGDEITIDSDEELMIALSEQKSNVLKFIVHVPCDEEKDTFINISIPNWPEMLATFSSFANFCPLFSEMQGDVTCHSCQQQITGIRYRCLECVQYYQCGDCEHKNVHPDHVMLRLTKSPSIASLIPKGIQIFKNHLIHGTKCAGMNACAFMREKMQGTSSEKDKHGGHHRRKFRKHGCSKYHSSEKQTSSEESAGECPYSGEMFNNIGNLVGTFLGMYKDAVQKHKETEHATAQASSSTTNASPIKTIDLDAGPAMPSKAEDDKMEEDPTEPSTSSATTSAQKDSKIKMALELLAEMGFTDDNQWLSRLLEHFHGDIAKTLDHLTLGK